MTEQHILDQLERVVEKEYIFGVRHHSPACAHAVVQAAEALQPEAIAVVMPADTKPMLPWIIHDDTKAPIALAVAAERGLDLLLWSEHTPDVEHARALTTRVHAGSIILCHDGRTQPSRELLRAVGDSLVALAERGMTFLTGSQMLAASQSQ